MSVRIVTYAKYYADIPPTHTAATIMVLDAPTL